MKIALGNIASENFDTLTVFDTDLNFERGTVLVFHAQDEKAGGPWLVLGNCGEWCLMNLNDGHKVLDPDRLPREYFDDEGRATVDQYWF